MTAAVMELYKGWQEVVRRFGGEMAIRDLRRGCTGERRWTFDEIQAELDRRPPATGPLLPEGNDLELVFETLRAWRDGVPLCPVDHHRPDPAALASLPASIVHVKMSSGSTGEPRMILFRGEQLAADVDQLVTTMALRRDWPNLGVISMAHSYGFSSLTLPLLLHGIPLAWCGNALPGIVGEVLGSGEGWTVPAVPAMWRAWFEAGVLGGERVRLAISAGSPLPLELERAIHARHGLKVHNFYGASECGGIAYDRSTEPRQEANAVGTAVDGVALSLDSRGALRVESAAVGEEERDLRGEPVAKERAEEEIGGISDGWFRTSDVVELDAATGEVRLLARVSDWINVAGRKVSPVRIEEALRVALGASLRHCLVFGIASRRKERLEEIVACLRVEGEEERETLKARVSEKLAPHERPHHWWFCQDLEPDGRGKLSRQQWRERFLEQEARA